MSGWQPPFTRPVLQAILIPTPTEIVNLFRKARRDVVEAHAVKLSERKARGRQRNDTELARLVLEDRTGAKKRQSVALIECCEPVMRELQGAAAVHSKPQVSVAVFA